MSTLFFGFCECMKILFALYLENYSTWNTMLEAHPSSDFGRGHSTFFWIDMEKPEVILSFPSSVWLTSLLQVITFYSS